MTRQEQLAYCRICHNRQMSKQGLICKVTEAKADFDLNCDHFDFDEREQERRRQRDLAVEHSEAASDVFAPERRGLRLGALGGIGMMLIAVIWFFGGYEAGYIFYYPPVLFIIGLVGLIKGLAEGNYSGEKHRK